MDTFRIDKGIPIPEPIEKGTVVPIESLEVGESILVDEKLRNSVQVLASRLKSKGKEYTVRKVEESKVRVWRTK